MIDLHNHIVPGIDDGAPSLEVALAMARLWCDDGVEIVACTPHITPGLYNNSGVEILRAVEALQRALSLEEIPLKLVAGADNHMAPAFIDGLRSGRLLPLAASRYVLVEPPHHVRPPRMQRFFLELIAADYIPILTHPERLSWIEGGYDAIRALVAEGVWLQITAGSLSGQFGRLARYWAERMLDDGLVHLLASDAHDAVRRAPSLAQGYHSVERRIGKDEAIHMVLTRPCGVIDNSPPANLPLPPGANRHRGVGDRVTNAKQCGALLHSRSAPSIVPATIVFMMAGLLTGCGAAGNSDQQGVLLNPVERSDALRVDPKAAGETSIATGSTNSARPADGKLNGALAEKVKPVEVAAGAAGYRIGPLDVVEVSVFKVPELSKTVQVAESGTINLPLVGEVSAVGRSAQDVERDLTAKLGAKYLRSPQVSVFVKEFNSQRVTVEGAVRKPGIYPLRGRTTLMQALAMAESVDAATASGAIVVFRHQSAKRTSYRFQIDEIRSGNAPDPEILAGDMIVVDASAAKEALNNFVRVLPAASVLRVF